MFNNVGSPLNGGISQPTRFITDSGGTDIAIITGHIQDSLSAIAKVREVWGDK